MLGDTIGIAEIIFILGLMGLTLWKRSWIRVLLSICLIIWGAFSMEYDMKIAGPVMAVGIYCLFDGIMNIIRGRQQQEDT